MEDKKKTENTHIQEYTLPIGEMIKLQEASPDIPYIWSGIKEGSFGFVYGPPKSGKTILCENLGLSIATGAKEFLGDTIGCEPQKVLFISLEEYCDFRTERNKLQVSSLPSGANPSLLENYLVVTSNFPRHIYDKEAWALLTETIENSGCKIVFVDSLTRMNPGVIEDSKESEAVSLRLRKIAIDTGITMTVIHHSRKLNGSPLNIDSLAGSRVLAQEADFLIGVSKTPSGSRYVKEVAFRYKQENEETVTPFKIGNSCWLEGGPPVTENSLIVDILPDRRRDSEKMEIVFNLMVERSQESEGIVQTGPIAEDLDARGIMSKPTFYSWLRELEDAGKILKIGKNRYQVNPESDEN
jgi:hypothetical protein